MTGWTGLKKYLNFITLTVVLGQNVIFEKVATGPRGWVLGLSGEVYYNNICREFGVVEVVEGEGGREGEREREGGREGGRERDDVNKGEEGER